MDQQFKKQFVEYRDQDQLAAVCSELQQLPPLVTAAEVKALQNDLAQAAAGRRFLLQLGDCAEQFSECSQTVVQNKINLFSACAKEIDQQKKLPVTILARIAGQYAKPRSQATQTVDGVEMLTYRGDLINGAPATAQAREADPRRLLQGVQYSALTLNYLRSHMQELSLSQSWLNDTNSKRSNTSSNSDLFTVTAPYPFFTSHEALSMDYEQALTHQVGDKRFNLGAHFLWVGMRTAAINSPACDYLASISNPIGLKVGIDQINSDLLKVLDKLDPDNIAGRLTLITRLGSDNAAEAEKLVRMVNDSGRRHLWLCDPMHGNTKSLGAYKTRYIDDMHAEISGQMAAHERCGSHLGGLHLEATGCDVTECVGVNVEANVESLERNYATAVDPRLNLAQATQLLRRSLKTNESVNSTTLTPTTESVE